MILDLECLNFKVAFLLLFCLIRSTYGGLGWVLAGSDLPYGGKNNVYGTFTLSRNFYVSFLFFGIFFSQKINEKNNKKMIA